VAAKIFEETRQIAASTLGITYRIIRVADAKEYEELFTRLAAERFMLLLSQRTR
jgi:hypothetical protein